MTPKEKAIDLYSKYEFVYIQNYTSEHEVKQCALIAVDEIESAGTLIDRQCGFDLIRKKHKEYWEQVRQEIQAL